MTRYGKLKTSGSRSRLREDIAAGVYQAGTFLPSVRELAKKLQLSKSSVHNIMKYLQEEGLISIYPNIGALVLENGVNLNNPRRFFLRPSDFGTFNYLPVVAELMQGIIRGVEIRNVEINLSLSDSGALTNEIIEGRGNGRWQGAIYLQCQNYDGLIAPLEKAAIPYVIAADQHCHEQAVRCYVDYRDCARRAVQYLAQKGHRRIGIVCGDPKETFYSEMMIGFRGGLAEMNLGCSPEQILTFSAGKDGFYDANSLRLTRNFLAAPDRPTALFCVRPYRLEPVCLAARELGLRIPEDLSIIGFGSDSRGEIAAQGVTNFEEPLRRQGEIAVAMLHEWVRSGERPKSHRMDMPLIERDSVAARH